METLARIFQEKTMPAMHDESPQHGFDATSQDPMQRMPEIVRGGGGISAEQN